MWPRMELGLRLQAAVSDLTRRTLGRRLFALVAETDEGLFAVDPEDRVVGRQLVDNGSYGREELERLRSFVSADSQVLVVGAHIGALVVPLARRCRRVVAFEANPSTFRLFDMNLRLNRIENCEAIHLAASDHAGRIEFLMSRSNSGGSKRVPIVKETMYYYDNPKTVEVEAVRLDDQLPGERFDLVVMDIEGSEYFALKGMPRILASAHVLAIEFLPHHLRNVSGATVAQLLELIEPHFSWLTVPSLGKTAGKAEFLSTLQGMYDRNQGDDGIIFQKEQPR